MTFVAQVDSRNTSASAIVPPEGPLDCKIAFVGEAPGAKEQAVLRPFIGPAGMELNKLLHSVGIVRSSCYITNVIKEQPKNNDITQFINVRKNFVTDAAKDYISHLKRELTECSANIIVALGNTALWALSGNYGVEKWRGSIIESTLVEGRKMLATFHPRAVIGPTGVYLWKHLISFDLGRAVRESEFPDIRHPAMHLQVRPSFEEAIAYLEECSQNVIVDVDIETLRNEVSCISFSYSNSSSISIPFTAESGDYWQPDQEVEIFRKIAEVLENPNIIKRGQNFLFDMFFLWRRHGIRTANIIDTMVAQAILFPDFKKGLDFIASIHTDIPYYKEEGKQWNRITGSWEQHWLYNCKDTITTSSAYPSLMGQLGAQDNLATFHRQNDLIEPLLFMQARGIKMDVVALKMASESVERQIDRLQNELWGMCGYELNPRSPAQLIDYFYNRKGIKPYVDRKTGRPTTDEKALTRLSIKGYKEADLILKLRDYGKLKGTYLDVSLDEDDRMRCSYNPVGAKTGRLSSSKNIFGTGGNLQNIPPEMKEFMLFDEGYVGYEIDLSQAENRIVAYCGPVPEMIQAFEDNKDVHRLTASLMFGVPYDQVSDEPGSTHLGGGRYSQRFFGKKCKLRSCEVLSEKGWIGIEEAYITNCKIAQWDNGIVTFVTPSSWFISEYSGPIHMLHNERFFQEGTPEHRMPVLDYLGRVTHRRIDKYPKSGTMSAPSAGVLNNDGVDLQSNLIQLLVAFQADGTWNKNSIKFAFLKKRKADRLEKILQLGSIKYTKREYGDGETRFYVSASNNETKILKLLLGKEKKFGPWLLELSTRSLNVFLSELPHWDGYREKNMYFTTDKDNASWVQTVCHLTNKVGTPRIQDNRRTNSFGDKEVYKIVIHDKPNITTHAINRSIRYVENEPILCPTVPSGDFMCREGGIVSITGNCNHSLNYDLGSVSFSLLLEIELREGKYLVESYHRAYPGVRNGFQRMIQDQVNRNRTILNPMGRKRLFLDRIDDELYKSAYGHFPQSTVADIISERGLNFIYYTKSIFNDVELLLQTHDSITFQIPLSVPMTMQAELVWKIKKKLETPIEWRAHSFVIPADLKISFGSMAKGNGGYHDIKGANSLEELTDKLCLAIKQREQ